MDQAAEIVGKAYCKINQILIKLSNTNISKTQALQLIKNEHKNVEQDLSELFAISPLPDQQQQQSSSSMASL